MQYLCLLTSSSIVLIMFLQSNSRSLHMTPLAMSESLIPSRHSTSLVFSFSFTLRCFSCASLKIRSVIPADVT